MDSGKILHAKKSVRGYFVIWECSEEHRNFKLKTDEIKVFEDHCWQCNKYYKMEIKDEYQRD